MMRRLMFSVLMMIASSVALGSQPLIVNIDNPSFRKVLVATPAITNNQATGALAETFASKTHTKLAELLTFSGFFNVVASQAYEDYMGKMIGERQSKDGKSWLTDMIKLSGPESVQWRTLGVESLTLGSMESKEGKLTVTLKTFDVTRNKLLVAKEFTDVKDFTTTVRRYADFVLEAYTGKPGIFSSKLTFVGRREKGSAKQIFISDYDGSNLKQITSGEEPHLSPAWSPDGRYIAYTSFEGGNPHIYIYDTQDGSKRRLTQTRGLNSGANWSPDGSYIAYTASNGGDTDIYVLPSKGGKRKLLIKGSGLDVDPKYSPDGKYIAFVSGRYGNPHIFVGTLADGSELRVVRDKRLTYAGWYNSTPAWSPESDKIIFGGYDKDIDRYDIFIMNPDGSQLERLTLKTGDNESPSWSPNGQMIAFQSNRIGQSNSKGEPGLFIMNRDGSGQKRLEIPLFEVQTPHWSGPRQDLAQ